MRRSDGEPTASGAPLHGDASLLELLEEAGRPGRQLEIRTQAAICYDIYGLPDKTCNPASNVGRLFMAPTGDAVNDAFDGLLARMLPPDARWLLRLPRRVAELHSLDARTYVSPRGGAAIVLPLGAFGGLFLVNELFHSLSPEIGLPRHLHDQTSAHLPELLAHWMLCRDVETPAVRELLPELTVLLGVRRRRWEFDVGERFFVWATTVVQQLFVLLHEFGHLVRSARAAVVTAASRAQTLAFDGADQELEADAWALSFLRAGLPGIARGNYLEQALYVLFGAMDLLRRTGRLRTADDRLYEQRWTQIARALDPMGEDYPDWLTPELLSRFEDVFTGKAERFQDVLGDVREDYERRGGADLAGVSQQTLDAAVAWNDQGCDRSEANRYEDAIRCFEQALALVPAYVRARCNLANAYDHLGQFGRAIETYEAALGCETDPGTAAMVWDQLGIAYRRRGDRASAERCRQRAMESLGEAI